MLLGEAWTGDLLGRGFGLGDEILDHAAEASGKLHHHLQRPRALACFDLRQVSAADAGKGGELSLVQAAVLAPSPDRMDPFQLALDDLVRNAELDLNIKAL